MKRHTLSTRLWHGINAVCVIVLFMSGLTISNAHPRLYWGHWGFEPAQAWLELPRFPGWMTIPSRYSLAIARDWHVLFAWIFALSLLVFMLIALANGHFRRDLVTRRQEWKWRVFAAEARQYLKRNFAHPSGKYGAMQKLIYAGIIFLALPLMIVSGMAISPGMDATWPWLLDVFGGRQSARSVHFLCASTLAAFTIVHVIMVLVSGPVRQLRGIILGGRADEAA